MASFQATPVIEYLSRSIAAAYGFHGVLIVSRDPLDYRAIVTFLAVMNVVFVLLLIGIDLEAGMPR